MHTITSRATQMLLVIALVTLGSQTAQAKARFVGTQATPTKIVGSVSLLDKNWSRSYMKAVRSVSVPGTLLSLGGGLAGFALWRMLRSRISTRQRRRGSSK